MHLRKHPMRGYAVTLLAVMAAAIALIAGTGTADAAPAATVRLWPTSLEETDIMASSTDITITLKGAKWNAKTVKYSSAARTLLRGFAAASEPQKWRPVQSSKAKLTLVSDTVLELTLPPISSYDIIRDQEIAVTIPKSLIEGASADLYAGSFIIKAQKPSYTIGLDDAINTGILKYWLAYTSPHYVFIYAPVRYTNTITITQQLLSGAYITIIDVTTSNSVQSVSVTWDNVTHVSTDYIYIDERTRQFSIGFAEIPPGADVIISVRDKYGMPLQEDVIKKVKTGTTEYNELPKTPLDGWYSLYQLINDTKLLNSVLDYYSPGELKAGAF